MNPLHPHWRCMPLLPPRVLWTQFWNVLLSPLCLAEVCGLSWIITKHMSWFSLWQCKPAIIYWEEKQNTQSTSVQDNGTVQINRNVPACLAFCGLPANMYLLNRDNAELRLTLYTIFCFTPSVLFDTEAVVSCDFCSLQWLENSIKTEASCFLWQFLSALGISP